MSQLSQIRRGQSSALLFLLLSVLVLQFGYLHAQAQTDSNLASKLAWSTDSTGPARFISVHGRRAAVFGYPDEGLEVWAYPFQILSSLKATFRPQGTTTGIDGQSILRRVIYSPEAVTRIYAGPDFVVRERIFVPLDDPGAIVSYEVASARPVDVVVRFTPVLDLMWPGGIGGEDATWNSAASAYVLSEQKHRFSGSIGSPDIIAHDDTPNQSRALGREIGLAFTIRAGGDHAKARVVIAGGPERSATAIAQKMLQDDDSLEKIAADHYSALLNTSLQIETRM